MKRFFRVAGFLLTSVCAVSPLFAKAPKVVNGKHFDAAAQAALAAMKARAGEQNIQGVAVVAFAPGDSIQGWLSEMAVIGHLTQSSNGEAGNNLLGIAYAKAAEAANALKDSGTSGKVPMTGEYGWKGGLISKVPGGTIIVAFSGGKQTQDAATAAAGLEVLKNKL